MQSSTRLLIVAALLLVLSVEGLHAFWAKNITLTPEEKEKKKKEWRQRHEAMRERLRERWRSQHPESTTTTPGLEGATSGSTTDVKGWFKIFVVGTGQACYVKEYERIYRREEQFGDFATTDAFVDFFGEPECETGDRGIAWGKIKASVAAAAYERGPECLTNVIAAVISDPRHQFSRGDVSVTISGEAEGEALALCDDEEPTPTPITVFL